MENRLIAEAVEDAISFWGFKRNHGRIWSHLYLEGRAKSATDLIGELNLSKAACSTLLKELEGWGVVQKLRVSGKPNWHYVAENDLLKMIGNVVRRRELKRVVEITNKLIEARHALLANKVNNKEKLLKLNNLIHLSLIIEKALAFFVKSGDFDVRGIKGILMRTTMVIQSRVYSYMTERSEFLSQNP